jgi:hypothetical protein
MNPAKLAAPLTDLSADKKSKHYRSSSRQPVSIQALHDPDPWRAQEQLHWLAQGFGGGTRIGESLAQFQREQALRLVHSRTAIVIFSDGYDTGDPQRLSDALAALRRRARRMSHSRVVIHGARIKVN